MEELSNWATHFNRDPKTHQLLFQVGDISAIEVLLKLNLRVFSMMTLTWRYRYLQQTTRNSFNTDYVSNAIWMYYVAGDPGHIGLLGHDVSLTNLTLSI